MDTVRTRYILFHHLGDLLRGRPRGKRGVHDDLTTNFFMTTYLGDLDEEDHQEGEVGPLHLTSTANPRTTDV